MAYQPHPGITSVVSTVPSSVLVGASVYGNVGISGIPNVNVAGSVVSFPGANQSVSGAIQISGFSPTSIVTVERVDGTLVGSALGIVTEAVLFGETTAAGGGTFVAVKVNPSGTLQTEAEVQGSVAVLQGTTPWIVSSIYGNISGSVVASGTVTANQGTGFGSVASHIKSGSVIAVLGGNTSVISANPQSSVLAWNSPIASWVSGTADLRSNTGASVAVLGAAGSGIANHITGVQVANYGPSSVLVTLAGSPSGGSILAYTIAPAGGGSNIVYPNALKTGANLPFTASINAVASVLISAQGFTN